MKIKKSFLFFSFMVLTVAFAFANSSVTITWNDGTATVTIPDLPDEIVDLVNSNMGEIVSALNENNVTQEQVNDAINSGAIDEIKKTYAENIAKYGSFSPLTDIKAGLSNLVNDIAASVSNVQLSQNVWAEAWAGQFLPKGFHIGAGINAGVASLKLTGVKNVFDLAEKFMGSDSSFSMPESLVFPTIDADIRIGGIFLPFDIGFSIMVFDSSKISSLNDLPVVFNYFTIGADARWALLKGEGIKPKLSVGAGFAYTKVGADFKDASIGVDVGLNTLNFYAQAQISTKLLFFIPFFGLKFGFANTNLAWNVTADWNTLFGIKGDIGGVSLQDLNIIPKSIGDNYKKFKFVPQIYGGFGFDLFIVNLTFFGGIDLANFVWSAGTNFRIAW